ncbi:hypothetical protein K2Z83_20655 [Oscillochloris sp. ZM17-4]|uniref:hypothetical protein n=1 Tax=Oscillochloris sp. ZM17-4 TaxID=2866714 RepID=UPI001C72B711|nr:hypothetical protein [Oscillochloris sp. ZM17-4]MBX0330082.1 hypothetical protein [Oscillochloris sp. ZM17-4]
MSFPDGLEIIFNAGGPDTPGRIERITAPNAAIVAGGYVHVQFRNHGSWVDPTNLRTMTLEDHRRIHGLRFCDWQERLWYTLIFRFYGRGFCSMDYSVESLRAEWLAGWSVAAAARQIAEDHRWPMSPHGDIPAYAFPYVADLGDEDTGASIA